MEDWHTYDKEVPIPHSPSTSDTKLIFGTDGMPNKIHSTDILKMLYSYEGNFSFILEFDTLIPLVTGLILTLVSNTK